MDNREPFGPNQKCKIESFPYTNGHRLTDEVNTFIVKMRKSGWRIISTCMITDGIKKNDTQYAEFLFILEEDMGSP